jgi:sporulation protein YlmC with PRC-barrel domain
MSEVRLELLIGRKVLDPDGRKVGRIEEAIAIRDGRDLVITEYHLGSAALVERLSVAGKMLGFHPFRGGYRVPWDQLDLSDPMKPRLKCPVEELHRIPTPAGQKK